MPTNLYTAEFDARRQRQRELARAAPPAAGATGDAALHPALAAVPGLAAGAAAAAADREQPVASAAGGSGGGSAAAAAAAAAAAVSAGARSRECRGPLLGMACSGLTAAASHSLTPLPACPAAGPSASLRDTRIQDWLRVASRNRIGPRLQALREDHRRNGLPL
jgi:hypothetical protein